MKKILNFKKDRPKKTIQTLIRKSLCNYIKLQTVLLVLEIEIKSVVTYSGDRHGDKGKSFEYKEAWVNMLR